MFNKIVFSCVCFLCLSCSSTPSTSPFPEYDYPKKELPNVHSRIDDLENRISILEKEMGTFSKEPALEKQPKEKEQNDSTSSKAPFPKF